MNVDKEVSLYLAKKEKLQNALVSKLRGYRDSLLKSVEEKKEVVKDLEEDIKDKTAESQIVSAAMKALSITGK